MEPAYCGSPATKIELGVIFRGDWRKGVLNIELELVLAYFAHHNFTMKKIILFCVVLLFKFTFVGASALPNAVYGKDDRKEWFEVEDQTLREWARSTAVLIPLANLRRESGNSFAVTAETYGQFKNLCLDQPFRNQPVPGDCTGFLVGDDLMVTAGHCFTSKADCRNYATVFDYALFANGQIPYRVHVSQVRYCKEVIARVDRGDYDFAIFRLDAPVQERTALRIRRRGRASIGERVTLIGHPMGMPGKISDGGSILGRSPLRADVDAFNGNSGSPVINRNTGEVEGILVNGGEDYRRVGNCNKEVHCNKRCEGETLFPITEIQHLIP